MYSCSCHLGLVQSYWGKHWPTWHDGFYQNSPMPCPWTPKPQPCCCPTTGEQTQYFKTMGMGFTRVASCRREGIIAYIPTLHRHFGRPGCSVDVWAHKDEQVSNMYGPNSAKILQLMKIIVYINTLPMLLRHDPLQFALPLTSSMQLH